MAPLRLMRHVITASWIVFVACEDSAKQRAREVTRKLVELTDAMCSCESKACAEAVDKKATIWAVKVATRVPDIEQRKNDTRAYQRMLELGKRYFDCKAALAP
jgi:hypothetical protein